MHLLKYFDKMSLRPENSKELKGLILDLAIRGRLTEEWRKANPVVEPASNLLERIKEEKKRLILEKKIRKEKPLPEISSEDISFTIPDKWVLAYLGAIGTTNVGLTYKPSHKTDNGVPVLRSSNIQNGKIDLTDLVRVNTNYREKDIIKPGDLLICARNGSRRLVGKCAIIDSQTELFVFGAFMAIFRSKFNKYIQLFINSPLYRIRLEGVETTTINQITQSNLKSTIVPLPPHGEQKAIVQIVNQLMEEVDQLEEQAKTRVQLRQDFIQSSLRKLTTANSAEEWKKLQPNFTSFFDTIESIDKLKEAILQLAVQGKLTKQWREENPDVESASVLLERIKEEKTRLIKEKKIKKEKPLPEINEDEIPFELPERWVWCRMQEIGLFERGKSKHRPRNDQKLFSGGIYPLVQTGDVSAAKNTGGKITTNKSYYNEFGLKQSRLWKKDTLCITIAANIAETGILDFDACFPDSVVGFSHIMSDQNLSKYIEFFIKVMKSDLEHYAPSTAQKNINLGILYQLKFPLPPKAEQKEIVRVVRKLFTECDKLKDQFALRNKMTIDFLNSSIKEVMEKSENLKLV